MASKLVASRSKSSTFVASAAKSHAENIQSAARDLLEPHLRKGEKLPDLAFYGELVARALEASAKKMVDADDAHELELADDTAPRDARDKSVQELYSKLVETAEVITGLYGAGATRAVNLDGGTPREAALLVRHATTASKLLRSHDFGKSRVKGASVNGKTTADDLDELVEAVNANLGDVARETREAEATLVKKHAAMSAFDDVFARSATVISALLAFGGQAELAARVRPSTRRPGEAAGEEEPTPPDGAPSPQP